MLAYVSNLSNVDIFPPEDLQLDSYAKAKFCSRGKSTIDSREICIFSGTVHDGYWLTFDTKSLHVVGF